MTGLDLRLTRRLRGMYHCERGGEDLLRLVFKGDLGREPLETVFI